MGRRLAGSLTALLALAGMAWRRSRRRARAAIAHTNADEPALLAAPPPPEQAAEPLDAVADATHAGELAIADGSGETEAMSNAEVEGEPWPDSGPLFLSVPWLLATEPPDPAATELEIHFDLLDGAMELDRIDVRETASQVFITVLARWEPPTGGWFAFDVEHEAIVELGGPLGDRALVHSPTDHPPSGAGGEPVA